MDEWRFQYPSTALTRTIKGDKVYAGKFRGEADKLLYELKNQMKFNSLGQHKMTRFFTDGTVITARSVFGQDFVHIDVSVAVQFGLPKCAITLYDLPDVVKPMKWYVDGIQPSEVEGTDYIKTYYRLNTTDCNDCKDLLDFTVCTTDDLNADAATGMSGEKLCTPFIFENATIPHRESDPPQESDIDNHCIHSLSGCQAEIISFDRDSQGTFFLWKAYTEWSNLGPAGVDFTQNGLGYLLLKGFVRLLTGTDLCTSEEFIIKVDCCEKNPDDRSVVILWEEGCVGGGFCPAPENIDLSELGPSTYFMVQPLNESCFPYEWILSGPGTLVTAGWLNQYATFFKASSEPVCNEATNITITVKDRCPQDDTVNLTESSCCQDASDLYIGYTTLSMSCSGSQTLIAGGGCFPYVWSLSGGGTLTPSSDTLTALYEAPESNEGCAFNPTIELSDCCGDFAQIQIIINCYTTSADAYVLWVDNVTWFAENCGALCGSQNGPLYRHIFDAYIYNCDGSWRRTKENVMNFVSSLSTPINVSNQVACIWGASPVNGIKTLETTGWHLATSPASDGSNCGCTDPGNQGCGLWNNNSASNSAPLPTPLGTAIPGQGDAWDVRTAVMIAAGCCPINPLTGLPF